MKNLDWEYKFVVFCINDPQTNPIVTIKSIWDTDTEAKTEVARLTGVQSEECSYHFQPAKKFKEISKFMTFEEFLSLKDPHYDYPRSAHNLMLQPQNWIQYYKCAKANWEMFGDDGPPIGSEVITLRPGHGGGEDELRTILSIEDGFIYGRVGGPYFILSRHNGISLVEIKLWWLHFTVPELSPFKRNRGWQT